MRLKTKKHEEWIEETVGEETIKFLISPMTPKEDFELLEKCKRKEWDRNQRFENTDFYRFKISKIDRIIRSWENATDEDGNSIECSRYNKEVVYLFNSELVDRVLERADKIGQSIAEAEEELEKNLEAGPSGPAKKGKSGA